ncbi:MAG TPA: hypothetical protein DGD08_12365 [Gemmatimonas aurantiaca]|uniref:Uncharacterized protein n=2 Tax=Gemmatimonas aurantiaca TaxID=173480 RepID=A0A3D4VA48_9BACT|nr:hypothetical protein [Gemmatimonas aurantiaca]BAH40003.1 hypothetical membrane protein [Gemmatimonas aurantiaca T-27]HCT57989.1 hypothetical protein [Gemmatimonas aurantiaca]
MSSDYDSGYDAGARGSIFGPATVEGTAGWMAGNQARNNKSSGSAEWLIAPFVLWPFVLIFYPVGGAATIATAFAAEALANVMGLGAGGLRWIIMLIPTVIVCWMVVRLEQQWGLRRSYYLIRHVVRMLILALVINGAATNAMITANNQPSLPPLQAMFHWPPQWLAIALWLVFWQLFFMRAHQWRIYWNRKLMSWFFRPKGFDPHYFSWRKEQVVERLAPIEMPGRR